MLLHISAKSKKDRNSFAVTQKKRKFANGKKYN